MRRRNRQPRNTREAEARNRAFHVLNKMRRGESLAKATRSEHVKPATVRRYLASEFRQGSPGKPWTVTKSDRLTNYMSVLTPLGRKTVRVKGYRERQRLANYEAALRKWRKGDKGAEAELVTFDRQTVGGEPLITDVNVLGMLEDAEMLGGFEELYAAIVSGA